MNFLPSFNQILTSAGWLSVEDYHQLKRPLRMLVIKNGKPFYRLPKAFDQYAYSGQLLEIESDHSEVILKPSTQVMCKGVKTKGKELNKNCQLDRFHLHQLICKITPVLWEGQMHSFFFGEDCLLPVKYDSDYILIPV
jgi:hypothetical protein